MLDINDFYVKFYAGEDVHARRGATLEDIILSGWEHGFYKEQVLIDCMLHGYALCIAESAVERIWNWWDSSYVEYMKVQGAGENY